MAVQTIYQIMQLLFTYIGRSTTPEICEADLPALKAARATVEFSLFDESIEIEFDLRGVLVSIDFEIAKLATLAAERYMKVKTKRIFGARRLIERLKCVHYILRLPL